MKIFITGGTGFVGGEVVRQLLAAGHEVRALARAGSISHHGLPEPVAIVKGGLADADLAAKMAGADAVIHLVGIIREYPSRGITFQQVHAEATRQVIAAMKTAGIRRLVHMSALGSRPEAETGYFKTKWEGEKAVMDSGLAFTVFKPSIIFGPQDEFINMLAAQVRLAPVVPVIGDGRYLLQPISVKNVAHAFVKCLSMDETAGKTYEVAGDRRYAYDEILDEIARALGKARARKIHLPLSLMTPVIRTMERFSFFPITMDQLKMLLINNVCDEKPFVETFGVDLIPFDQGIAEYIK